MATKKVYTKKAILKLLKNKTVNQAILELQTLRDEGFGDCKIELTACVTGGKMLYWKQFNGKIKCNILVPKEQ